MSSIGPRDGAKRPQICLGDLNGASTGPQYRELVAGVFRASGLEVELNSPFPGNELLRRHAAPADGIHGVQVEVRRDLYLDERTRVLHEGLGVIQDCIGRVAAALRAADGTGEIWARHIREGLSRLAETTIERFD